MGQLGLDNLPFLGFGAQKLKVGAQVRTFVRNAPGPSKMSFVWSENPQKAAPNICIFVIT